ncbi:MAG: hypothetical protein ACRC9Z_02305 [Weissella confusa]
MTDNKVINTLFISIVGVVYTFLTGVYLYKLNAFNRLLRTEFPDNNPFSVIFFENGKALTYLLGAAFFVILGALIIWWAIRLLTSGESFAYVISGLGWILVSVILITIVFIFINNPIFQSILVVTVVGISYLLAQE